MKTDTAKLEITKREEIVFLVEGKPTPTDYTIFTLKSKEKDDWRTFECIKKTDTTDEEVKTQAMADWCAKFTALHVAHQKSLDQFRPTL